MTARPRTSAGTAWLIAGLALDALALDPAGAGAAGEPSYVPGMLHDHDGVVERSAAEGRGQVEWQPTGPGLPYRD